MSYAIICNARKGYDLGITCLALVDRRKTRSTWWTSDSPGLILEYKKRSAAEYACKRLKKNGPIVVPYSDAVRFVSDQNNEIIHNQAMSDAEMGWDAHKDWR